MQSQRLGIPSMHLGVAGYLIWQTRIQWIGLQNLAFLDVEWNVTAYVLILQCFSCQLNFN